MCVLGEGTLPTNLLPRLHHLVRHLPNIWKSMNFAIRSAPRDLRRDLFLCHLSLAQLPPSCLIELSCAREWIGSFFFFTVTTAVYFMQWPNTMQMHPVSKATAPLHAVYSSFPLLCSWKRKCWLVPLLLFDSKLVSRGCSWESHELWVMLSQEGDWRSMPASLCPGPQGWQTFMCHGICGLSQWHMIPALLQKHTCRFNSESLQFRSSRGNPETVSSSHLEWITQLQRD